MRFAVDRMDSDKKKLIETRNESHDKDEERRKE